jgi:hypothetical protein
LPKHGFGSPFIITQQAIPGTIRVVEKPIELVPIRSALCNEQSCDQREKAKKALAQATGTESGRGDD